MNDAAREALRERLIYDTPFWAGGVTNGRSPKPNEWQGACKVVNKAKQIVPLIARPWQLEYDAALERQRAAGQPMRAIVLKARQLGYSTWTAAKFLQRVTQLPYQAAVVVAQDVATANHILTMAELMYNQLPSESELGLGFNIKPDLIGISGSMNNRRHMTFGERSAKFRHAGRTWRSVFTIDTAGTPEAGRGTTPNLVHLSEVARWNENGVMKMEGLLNGVPSLPETIVVLESTAHGMNHFQKRWVSAVDGAADPLTGENYAPIFAPWWRDPAAQVRFSTPDHRARFVESIGNTREYGDTVEAEPTLIELYGVTPEQLNWRRMQIRTQHRGQVEIFQQENPANPEEAFIASGRPYFSGILVAKAIKAAEAAPAPVLGTLRPTGLKTRRTKSGSIMVPTGAAWVPAESARRGWPWALMPNAEPSSVEPALLEVWEHPVTAESQEGLAPADRSPDGAYIVALDVAEGAADTFAEGDFHALGVFDHRTRLQVAQYESRIDRHLLPLWALLIGLYFNRAWIAVEVNSVGTAVSDVLAKDFHYPRLYRRRQIGTIEGRISTQVGWRTTPQSKPIAEDAMGQALESDSRGGFRSLRAARQLQTYVTDEKGRRGAMPGEHDDLLMMAMICHAVMEEMRPPRAKGAGVVRGRRPADDLTGW